MNGHEIEVTPYGWAMEEIKQIRDRDLIPALESLLKHDLWKVRYAAAIALSQMGESIAIPHLISAIEHIDSEYQDEIRDGLIAIGKLDVSLLIEHLSNKSGNFMIVQVLGILKNPDAVPALSQMLVNEHNGWVAKSLGEIGGPDAIAALKQALQDNDRSVRFSATQALGEVGIPAIPVLIEALDNSDWWVRKEATESLGRIGDKATLNKLEEVAQNDPHNQVRDAAELAYRELSGKASILIYKLENNNQIREELARIIEGKDKSTRPGGYTSLPARKGLARGREFRNEILKAIEDLAIHTQAELLQEDDVELINTLGKIGDEAAIPILAQALIFEGSSQAVQEAVKRVYSKSIAPGITDFDYHRVKQIVGDAPQIRRTAAAAMGAIRSKEAVAPLLQALKDDNEGVREAAALALGKIGDEQAVPYLVEALENNHGDVRQAIEESLRQCVASNSTPQLVKLLGSSNWTELAEEVLLGMGYSTVKSLCDAYRNSNDTEAQYRIVETLGKIGDREATSLLIEALENSDTSVSRAAVQALTKIGGIEEDGFEKLVEVFNDKQKSYLHPETAVALGRLADSIIGKEDPQKGQDSLESARKALWQRRFAHYRKDVFSAYEKVVTSLTIAQVRQLSPNDKNSSSESSTKTIFLSHLWNTKWLLLLFGALLLVAIETFSGLFAEILGPYLPSGIAGLAILLLIIILLIASQSHFHDSGSK